MLQQTNYRNDVIKKIKELIIPELRKESFKGSYPHFRRKNEEGGYDLLSFQFNRYGGSFLIEISVAYPNRTEYRNCYLLGHIPFEEEVKQINVGNTFERYRIKNDADEWFDYTDGNVECIVRRALEHLKREMTWFENPPIYEELEIRKQRGLRY